jgi:glyoxylase-like metal-dependent hydrolase (beta-lactamase superfamily II)
MNDMQPGVVDDVTPLVRRVLAPNPSVFTGPGTNTYLIGREQIAVIDPGPVDDTHLDAVAAAGDGHIRWILVTHTHPDHSPGAAGLKERTGAEVLGFDTRDDFVPDTEIRDGGALDAPEFRLAAVHTPGHASNHLCYLLDKDALLFSGDHIMSGSTVVIAPPDGDMDDYMRALEKVRALPMEGIAPGHGPYINAPVEKIDEYVTHRLAREAAILAALRARQAATIEELVSAVYTDVPEALHPIARYSVWAHLRRLARRTQATTDAPDDVEAVWHAVTS